MIYDVTLIFLMYGSIFCKAIHTLERRKGRETIAHPIALGSSVGKVDCCNLSHEDLVE
jgi:hypothetical protein